MPAMMTVTVATLTTVTLAATTATTAATATGRARLEHFPGPLDNLFPILPIDSLLIQVFFHVAHRFEMLNFGFVVLDPRDAAERDARFDHLVRTFPQYLFPYLLSIFTFRLYCQK